LLRRINFQIDGELRSTRGGEGRRRRRWRREERRDTSSIFTESVRKRSEDGAGDDYVEGE
jgi:hypothetical protein